MTTYLFQWVDQMVRIDFELLNLGQFLGGWWLFQHHGKLAAAASLLRRKQCRWSKRFGPTDQQEGRCC